MRHAFINFLIWLLLPSYHLAKNPPKGKGRKCKGGGIQEPC